MAHAEITSKKSKSSADRVKQRRGLGPPPTAMFSIKTFCLAHGISESFFHELRKKGLGPREMHLGARVFITHESAARWRIEREAATRHAGPTAPSPEAA
jgi:hypothetical protein